MMLFLAFLAVQAGSMPAATNAASGGRFCSSTARLLLTSCSAEVEADLALAGALCINVSDLTERRQCVADARDARREASELCRSQYRGRRAACRALGEARYDPQLDPAAFDDDFANPLHPNPYFPLKVGNHWEYKGGIEVNTLDVLNEKKLIDGLTCVVVRDVVEKSGRLTEDTNDWYAQAKDGTVWYCGEEVKDYESFDADQPVTPELVKIDGSFKAGRDGSKAGIIFLAAPKAGDAYLEEFSLANAEDASYVLSTNYSFGADPTLDRLVPQALAQLLCNGDCVVTRNESLLEPGVSAFKYFAPGIGFFLETNPAAGEAVQLTACNFDARCAALPQP